MSEKYLTTMLKMYEDKLKEYMTEEEYKEFAVMVAKKFFFDEVCDMPKSDFKDFILDSWDTITGEATE